MKNIIVDMGIHVEVIRLQIFEGNVVNGNTSFPTFEKVIAAKYEDKPEENKHKEEYVTILNAFKKLIYSFEDSAESWEMFEDIVTLRCSF